MTKAIYQKDLSAKSMLDRMEKERHEVTPQENLTLPKRGLAFALTPGK